MGEAKRKHVAMVNGMTRVCGNCAAWCPIVPKGGQAVGECRRGPKQLLFMGVGQDSLGNQMPMIEGFWPRTLEQEWCLEWNVRVSEIDLSRLTHEEGAA